MAHRAVFALLVALLSACGGASVRPPEALRPTACWFQPLPGVRVECRRLRVPENRAKPEGRSLELAVAIFHSRSARPRPDPVLFLTGGPGGAGIALARALPATYVTPFVRDRDLIVFDPRGSGWSRPSLTCRAGEAEVDCLRRWRRQGVDLGAYRSATTADDVETLRRALGIERWNVYGLSYGTRLALTLLRTHPERVRSVVLDSVVPPQVDEIASTTENAAEAIQRLLDRCAAEARCHRAYPDLPTALRAAVARLEREPLSLGNGVSLDGGGLLRFVYAALYDAEKVPLLPRAIQAAREGRLDPLWPSVAQVQRQISSLVATAAHLAWVCNEQVPFTTPARIDAVDHRFQEAAQAFSPRGVLDLCRAAGPPRASAVENRPVRSAVPTLLVTGRFDPVSPAEWAILASRSLSHGRVVLFPTLAHGVFDQSACVRRIALEFLASPLLAPDTRCVGRLPPVAWADPR